CLILHIFYYEFPIYIFFFSSRRRHTIFSRDWSSDVCSSDLANINVGGEDYLATYDTSLTVTASDFVTTHSADLAELGISVSANEDRKSVRVGKECRSG